MLRQILELQQSMGMSDGQLLALARSVAGDPDLLRIEDMIPVDASELETELLLIQFQESDARKLSAA